MKKNLALVLGLLACALTAVRFFMPVEGVRADAVVTDGRFTNVYVYPDPSKETWEQHMNGLPASIKPKIWETFTLKQIYAFTRTLGDEQLLVILNWSAETPTFVLPKAGVRGGKRELLLANYPVEEQAGIERIVLKPYEARVYRMRQA